MPGYLPAIKHLKFKQMKTNDILSNGKELNPYLAVAIAEGFAEGEEYQSEVTDVLKAWSYIGRNGLQKGLQGFFGRTLYSLADRGILTSDFEIDYEAVNELFENN